MADDHSEYSCGIRYGREWKGVGIAAPKFKHNKGIDGAVTEKMGHISEDWR